MKETLTLIPMGESPRLNALLGRALEGIPTETLTPEEFSQNALAGRRILFLISTDEFGPSPAFYAMVRWFRQHTNSLDGAIAGVVVDGQSELYTKCAGRTLVLAANLAGCLFPGKPLVEGTGSLYNQHILAKNLGLTWEETYAHRIRELAQRVLTFAPPAFDRPRLLMIHASDNSRSNTVWMGREVVKRLPAHFSCDELCLQNGTIQDCRGCSYTACLHFAQQHTCFYGGVINEDVLPSIEACDGMLFLCPNYNDAVSANIMALFNRLTSLLTQRDLFDKYLFGIVVSGYSGSDLVAQQLLGAMCFNKTAMLPPRFCLMQTANDPGSAKTMPGIGERLTQFADNLVAVMQQKS